MTHARAGVISYALRMAATVAAFWVLGLSTAAADLVPMSDAQMAQVAGTGFSRFEVDGNTVRADFNIEAKTYTQISSLKMGYWDDGNDTAWDQNWTNVQMGSQATDMTLSGFFIEATFDDLADTVNRKLTSVFFGFRQASGDLTADFHSLSRISVVAGEADDKRAALAGRTTFSFNNSEFAFSFQLEGEHRGIWVRFGESTTRQTAVP